MNEFIFVKTKLPISYIRMTVILFFFFLGYWFPILIASHFEIFDPKFGIGRDLLFYITPIALYSIVFVAKDATVQISKYLPDFRPDKESEKKLYNLDKILTDIGNEKFKKLFERLTSRKAEISWMVLFSIFMLSLTYGNWWDIHGFYYNRDSLRISGQLYPYTYLAGLTVFILCIISGMTLGSAFGFIISFTFAIFYLPFFLNKNLDDLEKNFSVYTIDHSENLPYSELFTKIQRLSMVIFKLFFELLVILMFITIIMIINQVIFLGDINYYSIIPLILFNIAILGAFFCNTLSIQYWLKILKDFSNSKINEQYEQLKKEYFKKSAEKNVEVKELEILEHKMSNLMMIMQTEKNRPTTLLGGGQIFALILPILTPLLGIAFNYIQKQLI